MPDAKDRHFTQGQIEQISRIIGDTTSGLTGAEIAHALRSSKIPDVSPDDTKWRRIYNALVSKHNATGRDNHVLNFIHYALEPARFSSKPWAFESIVDELNIVLSFQGLEFRDDGKFHGIKRSTTLTDATQRANHLRAKCEERGLHPQLLDYCRAELLENNYFHAVLEAIKGIATTLRDMTHVSGDGAALIDQCLSGDSPLVRINAYATDTEKGEQRGFSNLLKGLFGVFRNPTAHELRSAWPMTEKDALDLFGIASYSFRRLDSATVSGGEST